MTDQNPSGATPPSDPSAAAQPAPSSTPPAYEAPAYAAPAAPAYGSAPAAPYGAPVQPAVPGKTLGIVAFVLSFFAQLIALILGIVALVQSRKAGQKNGFALAAIIISAVLMVVGVIVAIVLITAGLGAVNELCQGMPAGEYELTNGGTIVCP